MFWEKLEGWRSAHYSTIASIIVAVILGVIVVQNAIPSVGTVFVNYGVVQVVVLLLLLDLGHILLGIRTAITKSFISVYKDRLESERIAMEYIRESKPSEAKLLEYSGATATALLTQLRASGARIRLLVQDPATASKFTSELQRKRIENSIVSMYEIDMFGYDKFEAKCYTQFPSLHGRKFGDHIEVGWYTPTEKVPGGILGHANPLVATHAEEPEAKVFSRFFDEVFDFLWKTSRDGKEVYEEIKKVTQLGFSSPTMDASVHKQQS